MRKDKRTSELRPTRIGELFLESKLTQRELAKKVGVVPAQIHNWCWGVAQPNADSLIRLSKGLNVSVDYLLGLTDNRGHSDTPIRDLLKERNLTVSQLAREAGLHRSTIYELMKRGFFDTRTLCKLADYFGVSTDFLLGR